MRTIEVSIFKFDELSDRAKERAREWCREGYEFSWNDEPRQSIEAFCEHFGVTLQNWSVGAYIPFEYATDAENKHFRGVKLKSIDRNAMPTGYCLDCALWFTFYDEFKRTGDAKHAFNEALYAGFKEWRDDMVYQLSDEAIDEHIMCNEYEFDEDGRPA